MQVYQQKKKKTVIVFFKKWIGLKWKIWIIVINKILKIQSTFLTSNQLLIMSVIAKSNWKLFFLNDTSDVTDHENQLIRSKNEL